jgi:hypothetical protein
MKKTKLWLFLPLASLLSSCALTSQAEIRGLYTHSQLEENYYTTDAFANRKGKEVARYEIDSDHYANGSYSIAANATHNNSAAFDTTYNGNVFRKGALSKYPSMFHYVAPDGSEVFPLASSAYEEWTIDNENDDADYYGKTFGRTKCLGMSDPAFKTGLFSKLYNGQTYCMAISNAALVQADSKGFSTEMPKSLGSGDYFLMSFRGGSTYGEARITTLDLTLNFYKKNGDVFDYYTVKAKNVYQCTDDGGEGVTFFGFQFSDIGFEDRISLSGWGVSFDNVSDPNHSESYLASESADAHFGVLIYEVMFPDSKWN